MYLLCAVIVSLILASWPAGACTPVMTVGFLLMGTAFYGGFIFASVGLAIAVIIKSVLYARFAGYGKGRAAFDMVMGNIGSTIAGILIGGSVGSSALTLPGIMIAGLVLTAVASAVFSRDSKVMDPVSLSLLTCMAMLVAFILLMIVESSDPAKIGMDTASTVAYWGFKIGGLFFALVATLAISVVFEGAVIFRMHAKNESFPRKKILEAIIKANLWTFLLLSVAGALIALPVRWSTPGFLDLRMGGF